MEQDQFHADRDSLQTPSVGSLQAECKRAASQLVKDKNKIKARWETKVRQEVHGAEEQTSMALINSLETFLNELISALESSEGLINDLRPDKGMSKSHGGQRAKFAGYFLPQLLKEFSLLREVITHDLNSSDVLTFSVRSIIDQTIDRAISSAATEFALVQQAKVEMALRKAEASNRDLEHFAAVAAHDLKSPLATISGYLDLLVDESQATLETDALEYIGIIQKTSARMRRLIDRLLEYARLAKSEHPFKTVHIDSVLRSALQNLHQIIENTNAKITWGDLQSVRGDMDLLIQLFQNLIANSTKFRGESSPEIRIDAKEEDGMILFSVKDNGIGFDPKNKEDIFALFKKLNGQGNSQGVGIGLATCRKVVELHGGRIWAESQLGAGSTFYFTLPKDETDDDSAFYH